MLADLEEAEAEGGPADEDEDEEEYVYNPLKLPLGWDGKPIPYWLYKLHGLNQEFKCEICGNYRCASKVCCVCYWGGSLEAQQHVASSNNFADSDKALFLTYLVLSFDVLCCAVLCSYWGRRAFERHFKEWRHVNGMKALGIPNNKDFFEVTQIADAQQLWKTIQVGEDY
jgi:splicing factor 3A subunit 3